jgi:NDP-sugar pyrophosphorylase family protein
MYKPTPYILCGGRATRLAEATRGKPKCLMPVADAPIILYIINSLREQGFKRAVICSVEEDSHIIEQSVGSGWEHDMKIEYSCEAERSGTAMALKHAHDSHADTLLSLNGDTLLDIDFLNMTWWHKAWNSFATVACNKRMLHYGEADLRPLYPDAINGGPVTKFRRADHAVAWQSPYTSLSHSGVTMMKPDAMQLIDGSTLSIEDIIRKAIANHLPVFSYTSCDFYDIGTLDSYAKVDKHIHRFTKGTTYVPEQRS